MPSTTKQYELYSKQLHFQEQTHMHKLDLPLNKWKIGGGNAKTVNIFFLICDYQLPNIMKQMNRWNVLE
jgi:hypothetical protein